MEHTTHSFGLRTVQLNHSRLLRNEYFDRFQAMFSAKHYSITSLMLINSVVTDALAVNATMPLEQAYVLALDMLDKLERMERKTRLALAA